MIPTGLGIEVLEEGGRGQAIARAPTALCAFVGRTLRGPVDRPVRIESFAEFQDVFGGLWQPSTLGYAVEHFFDSGGVQAFVVRIVNGAAPATLSLRAGSQCLVLQAKRPGTREFLRACVDYDNISGADEDRFNLTLQRVRAPGTEHVEDQEIFPRLSIREGAERSIREALLDSELAGVKGDLPPTRPDPTLDPASGFATGYVPSRSDGDDGGPLTDYDVIGSAVRGTGIFALNQIEHFNFLCIPPLTRELDVGPSALLVAARYCKQRRALLIVDPPLCWNTAEEAVQGLRTWNAYDENSFTYFPRILAFDRLRGRFESFAPCGAVAGILSRVERTCPVWAAADGTETVLRPGFRPNCRVTEERRLQLAALGVNTLQAVRGAVRSAVPARTLAPANSAAADWRFLGARRLALFILNSVERGTRWLVFAPRSADLAQQVKTQVGAFLDSLQQEGAFARRSSGHAYFVICDERVNPPKDAAANEFNILFGFAAMRLGDFHSFLVTHSVRGSLARVVSPDLLGSLPFAP